MPQNYKCGICDSKPDQLSHHKSHIGTQKHKDKRELFELKLEKMTSEDLQEKYGTSNIQEIVERYETKKVITVSKNSSPEIKKTISGTPIWNLETNQDTNSEYASIKAKLDSVVKRCHDLLYGQGGAIVGTKAQNDIMRLLCLKILQSQFNDENSELWERCNQVKADNPHTISDAQFIRFKSYCNPTKFTEIIKKDDIFKEWKTFVNKFLSEVFPSIYFKDVDDKFNCDRSNCIKEIIRIIDTLVINDDFKDAFSTTCGDIHESFRAYGGRNSGAKALGQYFTPRHLIHLMFHGIGLDSLIRHMDNITIYDPCMGTGGFLTRLFKMVSIPSENIYGCETEIDTIKFGEMSMVLTTDNSRNNIIKCDSLCENKFILDKKFSAIVTNPPFGTKMSYKDLKSTFESKFPEAPVKFEEIYPLKTNNGACLFVQHCVYMLAEGGFCAIVLPDGELFEGNSKWSKTFRKWLSEQVNIRTILKVASGTFEHAGVKTNVVVFTKDGPTQNIHFMETPKECNTVKDMFIISAGELKSAGYSLDVGEYLVEETDNYDVPMVALGGLCILNNGGEVINKSYWNKGDKILYTCSKESLFCDYNEFSDDKIAKEGDLLISRNGSGGPYIHYIKDDSIYSNVVQRLRIDNNYNSKFIYYYIKSYLDTIKSQGKGGSIPSFNMNIWNNLKIPLPSLEVQQQIVDELSQIETSIETIESRIAQLKCEKDQYKKYGRKAEIRELLKDSEEKTIKDLYNINYGNRNPTNTEEEEIYPSISGGSKISKYTNEWNILENTILIARSGSCGSVNMFETKCLMGSYGFFLEKKIETVNTQFNYYYLKEYQSSIENLARGTAVKNLNRDKLYDFKIPIPLQEIQQQCIALFEEKEKFIQSIDDKINSEKAYIEELKQMAKDVISSFC